LSVVPFQTNFADGEDQAQPDASVDKAALKSGEDVAVRITAAKENT
jgi:hypothetical protein